jgi:hypothetical protein
MVVMVAAAAAAAATASIQHIVSAVMSCGLTTCASMHWPHYNLAGSRCAT